MTHTANFVVTFENFRTWEVSLYCIKLISLFWVLFLGKAFDTRVQLRFPFNGNLGQCSYNFETPFVLDILYLE